EVRFCMAFQLLCENHSSLSLAACGGRFPTRRSAPINKRSSAAKTITSCPTCFFFRFTSLNLDYLWYLLLRSRSVPSRRGFILLSSQHRPLIRFQRDEDDESKGTYALPSIHVFSTCVLSVIWLLLLLCVMQMKMMNDKGDGFQERKIQLW
ncbi:hypothetical protein RYX36_016981, partial [Vicia faba]